MSQKRLKPWQRATALVPLALLSGAWTANLAAGGAATAATQDGSLPDGSSVPDQAIEAPASVSQPGSIAPGVPAGSSSSILSAASSNGIPAAALAAYQRAEQVINSADPACHLSWELLAAIGRVESNHGRYGGNVLSEDGKSRPGIFGIPLDGSNNTARISDTDAGQFDDDPVFDRAVGPMQFIPSTWSVVGVDGDGDDVRDPQDIDDAALASAVYLCSGQEDLSTTEGQRTSVYRYNHSNEYVDLVLALMNAYLNGGFSSVPNGVAAPTVFSPVDYSSLDPRQSKGKKAKDGKRGTKAGGKAPGGASTGGGTGSTGVGSGGETDQPGGADDGGTPDGPGDGGDGSPTRPVEETGENVQETVENTTENVVKVLDMNQAVSMCSAELQRQFGSAPDKAVTACAEQLVGKKVADAERLVTGVVSDLRNVVCGLLPLLCR